jgi:protease I
MAGVLDGRTIAFLVAPEGVEQVELTAPWRAVTDAGGSPRLVSTSPGRVRAFNHLDRADDFEVDATVDDVGIDQFDALMLPGGVANPDYLRTQPAAVTFAKGFFDAGKPVAVICHGPWTLVEADVLLERTVTSWPSLKTDIRNAGGLWVDKEVMTCAKGPNVLVSSRSPDDLKAFCPTMVQIFAESSDHG